MRGNHLARPRIWDRAEPAREIFQVQNVRQVNVDLAVAVVRIGQVVVFGIWVSDIAGSPAISWPRSARGFKLISIDDGIREEIEREIIHIVNGWKAAPEGPGA